VRVLYADLDGTLLGPGGSLFRDVDRRPTNLGARAIEACLRADVELVLMSGRGRGSLAEDARLFGQSSYIYEAGACVVLDGEEHWLPGDRQGGRGSGLSIHDQITATGAPALLLEHYAGRLEYHDPWHAGREVSHLFRGLIDAFEATALLTERGMPGLRVVDNGAVHRRSPALAALPQVRAYHLVPEGASKAGGVAFHLRARGLAAADAVAVGDSREDLSCAPHVGTFWLVANAIEKDPSIREAMAQYDNVRVAEAAHGAGVYEAVVTTLAERR
jgi:hydroxymethylpyrimidine pyrophosphatase-like HAD family hydrolase